MKATQPTDKDRQPNKADQEQAFYEAMPGTMDRPRFGSTAADDPADNAAGDQVEYTHRRNILPWLLVPLALLIGWALWNAMNNQADRQNGSTAQPQYQITDQTLNQ
jgi:ferric-dicitrate binding protein FerR (iron transport regulator)